MILRLEPIADPTIWGDDRLARLRHQDKPIGTYWEVSWHPYCSNRVIDLNKTLDEILPGPYLGEGITQHEMLRLAMLDARDKLSIQVHPGDDYAKKVNDFGKFETWYIIDAKPGAKLVAGTTGSDMASAINNLQEIEVHPGDFIEIPMGMIHALGAGIWALEIGTNSNTTFRFYDYDRGREIHLEHCQQVVDYQLRPRLVKAQAKTRVLTDQQLFVKEVVNETTSLFTTKTYAILSNLEKPLDLETDGQVITLSAYESVLIPVGQRVKVLTKGHYLLSGPKGVQL